MHIYILHSDLSGTYVLSHEREFPESAVRKKFEHAIQDAGRQLCRKDGEITFGEILHQAVEILKGNYGFSDGRVTQIHYRGQPFSLGINRQHEGEFAKVLGDDLYRDIVEHNRTEFNDKWEEARVPPAIDH